MSQKQEIFTMLGGRVHMRRGIYNPTSDAAWLAAMAGNTPAKTVLDVGIGSGGAALCLHSHQPNAKITGIDVSSQMLTAAADNAALNDVDIELIQADITTWRTGRTFDLVISNPPYFKGTPATHNAHHNTDLTKWTRKCVARTRPRGHTIIIIDAAAGAEVITAMTPTCGDINIFPLFGAKHTAERLIISARVGTHGPTVVHAGLPMNTDLVLRDGLTISDTLARLS